MNNSEYFRLQIKNVPDAVEDLLSAWCFEQGALGVSEQLNFNQSLDDYAVRTDPSESHQLDVYFAKAPAPEILEELTSRWPMVRVELQREQERDWLAEWKKGFKAFSLVNDVWVVPEWLVPPVEAKQIIRMQPGMAFGTGTHETTQLAAELLAEALAQRPKARVLDVGTGTGILAILARQLGAKQVMANDVDPEAWRVARENLQLNQIDSIEVTEEQIEDIQGEFDVVVANIIDGVLVLLQKDLRRLLAPGGALVLSGIIDERLSWFQERFQSGPCQWRDHRRKNEWHGFLLERPQ